VTPRRWLAGVGVVALLATATACGDDDPVDDAALGSTTSTTEVDDANTTEAGDPAVEGDLPPRDAVDLEPLYGEALAELGLRLTVRGGLIDRSGGGYVLSAEGDHLALYVEPIGDYSVEQYIEGIRSVALVFDDVFERWPGLASYDVCQEPVSAYAAGGGEEPLPVTQIELTRAEAAAIDLETSTVVDLVRAAQADPPGLALRVSSELATDPAYEALVAEARA
jgi:hypothetical protein